MKCNTSCTVPLSSDEEQHILIRAEAYLQGKDVKPPHCITEKISILFQSKAPERNSELFKDKIC